MSPWLIQWLIQVSKCGEQAQLSGNLMLNTLFASLSVLSVIKLPAFFFRDVFLVLFIDSGFKVRGAGTNDRELSAERLIE